MQSVLKYCGDDFGVEGATVGWANFPIKALTKYVLRIEWRYSILTKHLWQAGR
jgi:hypothetical protein